MQFKRYARISFVQEIGRPWLTHFLYRFKQDLAIRGLTVPAAHLTEEAFYSAVFSLALGQEGLPETLIETLHAIENMANAEGHDRLLRATEEVNLGLVFDPNTAPADLAVQVWLLNPVLFAEKHNEQQFMRMASFEYFGGCHPMDFPGLFQTPDAATLTLMTADLDAWFRSHNRGEEHTCLHPFEMDEEFWFLIRHGDTFAHLPTAADKQRVVIIHFRRTKDDLLVYNPERHELRVHAGTKGERDLYVGTFGLRVFGHAGEFSERRGYTLTPLLTDGPEALNTFDISGIDRIVLREVEWASDNDNAEATVRKANDLFATAASRKFRRAGMPAGPRLAGALFDFYFSGSSRPHKVQVRPPGTIQVGRHRYERLVHEWLSKRGFRVPGPGRPNSQEVAHGQLVARA